MRQLERNVLLSVIDRKWREHLYEMDYLKEGIGLRAMAQRDPLVEYQREGFDMFMGMLDGLKEESVGLLFNAQVQAAPPPAAQVGAMAAPAAMAEFAKQAAAKAKTAPSGNTEAAAKQATADKPADDQPKAAPTSLRVKGVDDNTPPLTYSGPSEDGSAQVRGGGGREGATSGGTRKERREAARKQSRSVRRG